MTPSTTKRRWLSPRFSLAGLLLFMTAVAIAVWVWTWPYEVITQSGSDTLVMTYRRTLTGGEVEHGPQRLTTADFESVVHFQNGKEHGPFTFKGIDGTETTGQYRFGEYDGVWTSRLLTGYTHSVHWRDGQIDGTVEIRSPGGTTVHYAFKRDWLLDEEGRPIYFPLLDEDLPVAVRSGLREWVNIVFLDTKIGHVVKFMADLGELPIKLDPRVAFDQFTLKQTFGGIRLLHLLQIIAHEHDLTCRYHDGAIWLEPRGEK